VVFNWADWMTGVPRPVGPESPIQKSTFKDRNEKRPRRASYLADRRPDYCL